MPVLWLVIGAVAALSARRLFGGVPPFGDFGDLLMGLVGGVLCGFALAILGFGTGVFDVLVTSVGAAAGAAWLIWFTNQFR
jgi:uncharacterized membrane protein YeaQ/YmgE (transglycosylase-associated protein family)